MQSLTNISARIKTHLFPWLLTFLAAVFLSAPCLLHAQVDAGSVRGRVVDAVGAAVAGAKVTLRDENTDVLVVHPADANGNFTFSPVTVGTYALTIEHEGFATVVRSHLSVNIQQNVELSFALQAGEVQQTIDVTSTNILLLQTESSSVGQVIGQKQINDLPLNGRNYFFLAQLSAGVTFGQTDKRGNNSNGRFTANGTRATANDYLLDGIDNNSSILSRQNGKDFVILTPVDALSEFKIQTNNYSAEFGRSAGGIINATVKTGTNKFHGNAWEFFRNQNLDANDYFNNQAGLARPEFHRNQFGGTLGGPVILPWIYNGREKTFFFVDYEGTRVSQGNTMTATVPTNLERDSNYTDFSDLITYQTGTYKDVNGVVYPAGTIFDPSTTAHNAKGYYRSPFVGNRLPAGRIDSNSINILKLLPRANVAGIINNYVTTPIFTDSYDSFDVRIDHNLGSRDRIFARYSYNNHDQQHGGPFTGYADGGNSQFNSPLADRAQNLAVGETHIFSPNVINDLRIGVNREATKWLQPYANTFGIPEQFGIQGVPQTTNNGGLTKFIIGNLSYFGSYNAMPSVKYGTTPQLTDDLTFIHGRHTMKFGFEVQRVITPFQQPPNSRGVFNYNGLYTSVYGQKDASTALAMMLLKPTPTDPLAGPTQVKLSNNVAHNLIRSYYAGYVQDDWKAMDRLTLNMGLRYEYFSYPHDRHGLVANFIPGDNRVGGTYLVTPEVAKLMPSTFTSVLASEGIQVQTAGQLLSHAQPLNFAPRFGFAYQVDNRFVVRGGYGLSYGGIEEFGGGNLPTENFPIEYAVTLTSTNAGAALSNDGSIGSIETTMANISLDPATVTSSGITLLSMDRDWKTTYTQSTNLMLQFQPRPNWSMTVGYVGSTGRHIITTTDANQPTTLLPPGTSTTPYLPYPKTASTGDNVTSTNGSSNYNSLQVTLEKGLTHGFSFLTNYTYQKTLTTARDPLEGDIGDYRAPYLASVGIGQDQVKADFNVPQIFHFSGTWVLPFGSSLHGFAGQVLKGWSLNGVGTAQMGQPITVGCPRATTVAGFNCHAVLVPGVNAYKNTVANFLNPAAFHNPDPVSAIGQGDISPLGSKGTQVDGPSFRRIDASLFKRFNIKGDRTYAEFRFEVFNVTNTANFANPTALDFTNSLTFGQITATRDSPNDPREIQLAAKIYF
jgi:hypothetical protein